MQLPDETIEYHYQGAVAPPADGWTPLTELQARHLLNPARLRALLPQVQQVRSQVAAERELIEPPPDQRPVEAGFIDLPQRTLDLHRKSGDASDLARVLAAAQRLRKMSDRVVVVAP